MHICYYISGHGFGHGVRSCAICNQLDVSASLTIFSSLPEWFFNKELRRNFKHVKQEFDCGCIQSDGITVDIKETLRLYMEIAERNISQKDNLIRWTKENNVDVIVSDIVPFAFEVAHDSGVPSVAISNFSWLDIYEPYAVRFPGFKPYIRNIKRQYGMADMLLALEPPNLLKGFTSRRGMPVVGRKGINRPDDIRSMYGIDCKKKLALLYLGEHGLSGTDWKRLELFTDWEFIGLYGISPRPSNFHIADGNVIRHEDLAASMDCIIAKLGYGVYSECLINAVPIIYLPRTDFSEYPVLERSIQNWGYGYRLDPERFKQIDWQEALLRVVNTDRPQPYDDSGALLCARAIEQLAQKKPDDNI